MESPGSRRWYRKYRNDRDAVTGLEQSREVPGPQNTAHLGTEFMGCDAGSSARVDAATTAPSQTSSPRSKTGSINPLSSRAELRCNRPRRLHAGRHPAKGWASPCNAPPYCFAGATIFITNEVGASPGPNGPGTLLLNGGRLLR